MTDSKNTADFYLGIAATAPEMLFSTADEAKIKEEYRALAKTWHPDRNKDPRAATVMQNITALYNCALGKLKSGTWETPNLFRFKTLDGKVKQISYIHKTPFDLGDMYIGHRTVSFVMHKGDNADLFNSAKDIITKLAFPSPEMKTKLEPILPRIAHTFETSDKLIMVLKKEPDEILLSDIVKHYGGKLPPVHTAWIQSRLHNLSCYLDWAGIAHNAIATDTCFISAKDHSVSLLGGWWYATKVGQKLKALPGKTASMVSPTLFDQPIANKRVDLSLIRAVGREILGDATGMRLVHDKDIPEAMRTWVTGPSSGDAKQDYKIWSDTILAQSFGARRFVEMKLQPSDIYHI